MLFTTSSALCLGCYTTACMYTISVTYKLCLILSPPKIILILILDSFFPHSIHSAFSPILIGLPYFFLSPEVWTFSPFPLRFVLFHPFPWGLSSCSYITVGSLNVPHIVSCMFYFPPVPSSLPHHFPIPWVLTFAPCFPISFGLPSFSLYKYLPSFPLTLSGLPYVPPSYTPTPCTQSYSQSLE